MRKKEMEKPKPKVVQRVSFDYNECRDYLQEKFGYNERDFAGKFSRDGNTDAPYQDFWHFVIECDDSISDGCYFTMDRDWVEDFEKDDFRSIILNRYVDEFGGGSDSVQFWVEW